MPTTNNDATERHSLPYIMPSQAQKHVTHNEMVWDVDRLLHLTAIDRDRSDPPAEPQQGDCYVVGQVPTGLWSGHAEEIAIANGSTWKFIQGKSGFVAYVEDEAIFIFHDGASWQPFAETLSSFATDRLAINAPVDPLARLAVASDSVILTHDAATPGSGDFRAMINKSAPSKTASLVFETNWSARTEIGTTGTDDFQIKTSPNGASWKTAMKADPNGVITVPERLCVGSWISGASLLNIAGGVPIVTIRDIDSTGNQHIGYINWLDSAGSQKCYLGLASASTSEFFFVTTYSDGFSFHTSGGNYPIQFIQNGSSRLRIHTNGHVGVNEAAPTAPLHVNGAARVGSYTVASMPSAASLGAGSILFVSNESGGATLAFSDGSSWRRVQDRAVVT